MTMNILRLPDVKQRTGLSRSQIYTLIRARKFPRQIELGLRAVGWLESDVSSWLAGQINKTNAKHGQSSYALGGQS